MIGENGTFHLPASVKIGAIRYGVHEFEPDMADGFDD